MTVTYLMPAYGWTCFHCGETFKTPVSARTHFGETPDQTPACIIKAERGLLRALRKAESQCRRHQSTIEELDYSVEVLECTQAGFLRCCQAMGGAKSGHEAFHNYDAMEGRAIAAETLIADISRRWPALVEASRRRVGSLPLFKRLHRERAS